jgi:type IV secretory pathway VirB2 component (pilin)
MPNTWLDLAVGFGRFGALLLMFHYFLLLLAPIFWMVDFHSLTPAQGRTTLEEIILILSGPELLIHVANLLAIPGIVFLATALLATVAGLRRRGAPTPPGTAVAGVLSGVVLLLWIPVNLYAQGSASGALLTLDQVAATGGFTISALLLLVAALSWMAFTRGKGKTLRVQKLTCYYWPVFAAVNVLGATAIAAFFQSMAVGAPSQDAYLVGTVLKVTLVPVLGVMAYAVLRDKLALIGGLPSVHSWEPRPIMASRRVPPPAADDIGTGLRDRNRM